MTAPVEELDESVYADRVVVALEEGGIGVDDVEVDGGAIDIALHRSAWQHSALADCDQVWITWRRDLPWMLVRRFREDEDGVTVVDELCGTGPNIGSPDDAEAVAGTVTDYLQHGIPGRSSRLTHKRPWISISDEALEVPCEQLGRMVHSVAHDATHLAGAFRPTPGGGA